MKKNSLAALLLILIINVSAYGARLDDIIQPFVRVGSASGVILKSSVVDKEKHTVILTANHVIARFKDGKVPVKIPKFNSHGRLMSDFTGIATVLKQNETLDYAILLCKTNELYTPAKTLKGDEFENLSILDEVISVGCPNFEYMWVTKGIIASFSIAHFPNNTHIGHESKIYYGNSGGPLFLKNGKLIGINTNMAASYQEHTLTQDKPENMSLPHMAMALALKTIYNDLSSQELEQYFGYIK